MNRYNRYSIRMTDGGFAVCIPRFNKIVAVCRTRAEAERYLNDRYERDRAERERQKEKQA